jgi:hypothetical protein
MKNNWMMLALLLGGLFLLRRNIPAATEIQRMASGETNVPGISGTTGMYGEG